MANIQGTGGPLLKFNECISHAGTSYKLSWSTTTFVVQEEDSAAERGASWGGELAVVHIGGICGDDGRSRLPRAAFGKHTFSASLKMWERGGGAQ